jgi:hypothetical protein
VADADWDENGKRKTAQDKFSEQYQPRDKDDKSW